MTYVFSPITAGSLKPTVTTKFETCPTCARVIWLNSDCFVSSRTITHNEKVVGSDQTIVCFDCGSGIIACTPTRTPARIK